MITKDISLRGVKKQLEDVTSDVQLLETLLYSPEKGFAYLSEHLDRMEKSAKYPSFL